MTTRNLWFVEGIFEEDGFVYGKAIVSVEDSSEIPDVLSKRFRDVCDDPTYKHKVIADVAPHLGSRVLWWED